MSLDEQVSQLLQGLGDRALVAESRLFGAVDVHRVREQAGLTREQADESLDVLVARGMVELERGATGVISSGKLTEVGYDCYLRSRRPSAGRATTASSGEGRRAG
jgi:RIO-like serine/threonine protein kinase